MRQMPGEPGREGVAQGEAVYDLFSDEAYGHSSEHPCTGLAMLRMGAGSLLEAALTR
jgi:hypothetical protein